MEEVGRTRVYVKRIEEWEKVVKAHGRVFGSSSSGGGGIAPANTLVQANLVGEDYLVEIEAEAEVLPPTV